MTDAVRRSAIRIVDIGSLRASLTSEGYAGAFGPSKATTLKAMQKRTRTEEPDGKVALVSAVEGLSRDAAGTALYGAATLDVPQFCKRLRLDRDEVKRWATASEQINYDASIPALLFGITAAAHFFDVSVEDCAEGLEVPLCAIEVEDGVTVHDVLIGDEPERQVADFDLRTLISVADQPRWLCVGMYALFMSLFPGYTEEGESDSDE